MDAREMPTIRRAGGPQGTSMSVVAEQSMVVEVVAVSLIEVEVG